MRAAPVTRKRRSVRWPASNTLVTLCSQTSKQSAMYSPDDGSTKKHREADDAIGPNRGGEGAARKLQRNHGEKRRGWRSDPRHCPQTCRLASVVFMGAPPEHSTQAADKDGSPERT